MPTRIKLTRRADAELDEIFAYLSANASVRVARRVIENLRKRIDLLADYPRSGAPRDALGPGRRLIVSRPYVAIYQIEQEAGEEVVVILHIAHGARDLEALLAKD